MNLHIEILSAESYLQEAANFLEARDLVGFVANINRALVLIKDDPVLLAKGLYINARGLYLLHQYEKALDAITDALEVTSGIERLRLLKYKGLILGYRGHFAEAIELFKELLEEQIGDQTFVVEIYINVVWANLTYYRVRKDESLLDEAKIYLDLVYQYFDSLSALKRKRILNNYGDYYWQKSDYDNALLMLEKVKEYCEEKDLPEIYNSLAELYLISDNFDLVKEYVSQAEIIATRHNNQFEVAQALYNRGMANLKQDDLLKAKDSFYIALTYFCYAQAYPYAFKCFKKILEISQIFNLESIELLQHSIKAHFKDTPYYGEIIFRKEGTS